jgi:hypothetical protein
MENHRLVGINERSGIIEGGSAPPMAPLTRSDGARVGSAVHESHTKQG